MIAQVPVIVVFTKYDQFKRDVRMNLADKDDGCGPGESLETVVESVFNGRYLADLSKTPPTPPYVRLESEHF